MPLLVLASASILLPCLIELITLRVRLELRRDPKVVSLNVVVGVLKPPVDLFETILVSHSGPSLLPGSLSLGYLNGVSSCSSSSSLGVKRRLGLCFTTGISISILIATIIRGACFFLRQFIVLGIGRLRNLLGISLIQEILVEGLDCKSFLFDDWVCSLCFWNTRFVYLLLRRFLLRLLLRLLHCGEIDALLNPLLNQNFELICQICWGI